MGLMDQFKRDLDPRAERPAFDPKAPQRVGCIYFPIMVIGLFALVLIVSLIAGAF